MQERKHVGRVKASGRKCLVVFKTLPNDAFNCLVILTENLSPMYHDALIALVDTNAAQTAFEFAEVLTRSVFPDGTTMLPSLHVQGLLTKLPTDQIEMTPNTQTSISLAELNQLIAEIRGVSVQDLAIKDDPKKNVEIDEIARVRDLSDQPQLNQDEPILDRVEEQLLTQSQPILTDAELAKKYRSDADRLSKEAAELRRLAEDLVPTKKKATKTSERTKATN